MKPISFGPFLKGLIASNQVLAQPKGSIARDSNLIYTERGALLTCDGTQILNWFDGAIQTNQGEMEAMFLFQPTNVARYFMVLAKTFVIQLPAPTQLIVSSAPAGGTLPAGTYYYEVTAIDGAGGETTVSNEVIETIGANHKIILVWNQVPNAAGYNVYRGPASGSEALLVSNVSTNTYTDDGSATTQVYSLLPSNGAIYLGVEPPGNYTFTTLLANTLSLGPAVVAGVTPSFYNGTIQITVTGTNILASGPFLDPNPRENGGGGTISQAVAPPTINTTQQVALYKMPNFGAPPLEYDTSNIVALFPADARPILPEGPGGSGGGGGTGTGGGGVPGGSAPTGSGGVAANTSPIPQMVQFNNQLIMALGNGFPPQVYTDPNSIPSNVSDFYVVSSISTVVVNASGTQATVNATAHKMVAGGQGFISGNSVSAINNAGLGNPYLVLSAMTNSFVVSIAGVAGGTTGNGGTFTPTTIPIQNSFVPAYPTWTASSQYATDSVVQPMSPNGFYYTAVAPGGASGNTQPIFPTTIGQQVADGSIIWVNAGAILGSAPAPPGAAHAIVYAGSLWVENTWINDNANGIDGPTSIRMSDVNQPFSWNPINQAFLDKDDGTQGQGMASFTITAQGIPPQGSLVAFKDFASYQISGVFGAADFAIQRTQSDMGCTAPRSIQFIPGFGIARMTHLGNAVFDGVRDKIISEEIRPYLFPSNDLSDNDIEVLDSNYAYSSQGFQTANPPMYGVAIPMGQSQGMLTRVLCYDLVLKCWGVVDLPFAVSCAAQVRAAGTAPIAVFGGFEDGVLQRWQAGDTLWYTSPDTGFPVDWSFRSNEIASQIPDQRLYMRRWVIRGYNSSSTAALVVTVSVDGKDVSTYTSNVLQQGDFDIFVPVNVIGLRGHATIAGSGDVQIVGITVEVVPKAVGVPAVIA